MILPAGGMERTGRPERTRRFARPVERRRVDAGKSRTFWNNLCHFQSAYVSICGTEIRMSPKNNKNIKNHEKGD
jgi:hypothetical protein